MQKCIEVLLVNIFMLIGLFIVCNSKNYIDIQADLKKLKFEIYSAKK